MIYALTFFLLHCARQWCGGVDFDGVLVFDESHKAKNLDLTVDKHGKQKGSKVCFPPTLCRPSWRAVIEIARFSKGWWFTLS